jgi:ergothioneine biosynthesis protein EgtB
MSEDSGRTMPSDLTAAYALVRSTTERLATPLSAEDQTIQSMPDASPTKWHRAHVTWFFETFILGQHARGYRPFNDAFAYIFNSYYEALGDRHPRNERGLISRPGIEEVGRYRHYVDDAMQSLLARSPEPELVDLVTLGLHHEQQHQELLLMDIKHVLSRNPLRPTYLPASDTGTATAPPKARWIEHESGVVEIGHSGFGFGFDNEFPRYPVHLSPFALADRPVTCGEWLSFMEDGGYARHEFWLSDGWSVVMAPVHPLGCAARGA